jgi:murein DD-endopeptidase MepM/ murein hydrolase activator NlpD
MRRPAFLLLAALALPAALPAQLADRPVFAEVRVPKAPTVLTGRAGDALTYEVHVTNFERAPFTWTRLEVQDAATGEVIATLGDSAFQRDIQRPGLGAVPFAQRATINPGLRAILFVSLPVPHGPVPAALRHVLTVTDTAGTRTLVTSPVPVHATVAVIGPPFRGGPWFAANGPSNGSGHRRALIPIAGQPAIAQRFAIDWVKVDTTGRTHQGDSLDNARYYAEDADVIAVADGIVRVIKDGIPENVPGITSRAVPITLETVGGNHVILDIGAGRYAFYAHLRPGSLRVKPGDRVKKGQLLAKLGNSGNSTEPHLHFHLMDGPSPLGGQGIPYVFEKAEFVGTCALATGKCTWGTREVRTRVMPVDGDVVRFP